MASLELRSDRFRIVFSVGGKKLHASLKTTDQRETEGCLAKLEENLRLMERGRLIPPPDADIPTFLLSEGKVAEKLHLPEQALPLEAVIRRYVEVHSNGAVEENSLQTVEMHLRHCNQSLGAAFAINRLNQENLQARIDRRAKKKGIHKRKRSPATARTVAFGRHPHGTICSMRGLTNEYRRSRIACNQSVALVAASS